MADADGLEIATDRSWLLLRPAEVIMPLPVAQRWEFTRRHPYCLQFWQAALRYHDSPSDEPLERLYEEVAVQILGGISVAESMRPPDPHFGPEACLDHCGGRKDSRHDYRPFPAGTVAAAFRASSRPRR